MRLPLSWLRELVPVEDEPDRLADRLSLAGFAVEDMERTGAGISGVVVGEVRAMREHPNADSLMLVRAFDGTAERDIVCGARNYAVGDRVPLALPGAKLPNGMEIAQRTVRGETSDGMLCSASELRLAEDHTGILLLDDGASPGDELTRALDLDDVVLTLDVTTNRGDALSIAGIAREVAALYKLPFSLPAAAVAEGDADASAIATVRIEDARGCPRYVARVIEGVTLGRSPWRIRRRLMACGVRPISNIVDVTNYVMLERGQPLHAFDLDRLEGSAIVVRRAKAKDTLVTLDGQERSLEREDVLICDANRAVALAGVMGGGDTEVTGATTRILLESAYFDPLRIRRTAARLGMRTEASVRFERGADPEGAKTAADLAASLIAGLGGGTVARGAIDVYPKPVRRRTVRVRPARVRALLGAEIAPEEMQTTLRALGCDVEMSRSVMRVTVPTHRPDLEIEEDLVEEVARMHGYDVLPETLPPAPRIGGLSYEQRRRRAARAILGGRGLNEAHTLSLLPPSFPDRAGLAPGHRWRDVSVLDNPLSEEESTLRPSLLPGLILAAQRNAARRVLPVLLFETGRTFSSGNPVAETERAAWIMGGPAPQGWHEDRPLDLFDVRGALAALLDGLGVSAWDVVTGDDAGGLYHPARAGTVRIAGAPIGSLAELHPRVIDAFDLPAGTAVCEIEFGVVLSIAPRGVAHDVPRFPATERDVALIVPDAVPAAEVGAVLRESGGALLERVSLFDVYRGAPVPDGSVSLAWSLAFRAPDRTLTDEDAEPAMRAIAEAAAARGWTVRD